MKKYIRCSSEDLLQQAIDLINNYYSEEFTVIDDGEEMPDPDQQISKDSDLSEVGLMYTTTEDGGNEVQVVVNLNDPQMLYFVDNKLAHRQQFNSLQELIDSELTYLDWDELYNRCLDYIGEV